MTALTREHLRQCGRERVHHPHQVDAKGLFDIDDVHRVAKRGAANTGVGDDQIDRPQARANGRERGFHLLALPHIRYHRQRGPAACGNVGREFMQRRFAARDQRDLAAFARELPREFPPHPARRSGDKRNVPRE